MIDHRPTRDFFHGQKYDTLNRLLPLLNMLLTCEQLEARESARLASYAARSAASRGREYPEPNDPYRTIFQRDRDRVIHSKAFRRSRGKTQVFVAHYGDHYRSRMVHSMEVAQISRDMARTFGLNEDLAEAIALAHDLGHPPFAHAGEHVLNDIMQEYGSHFEHNEHSLRVVEQLEYRYADFVGLNLTYEVRDGLIKHRTSYDNPKRIDHPMPSLEAQVVNLADEIAYQNHDLDDGLRADILKLDSLEDITLWHKAYQNRSSHMDRDVWIAMTVTSLIKLMIDDVYATTEKNLKTHGIQKPEDVYQANVPLVSFSTEMQAMNDQLKHHLYEHFYQSPGVSAYNDNGQQIIRVLFKYFMEHTENIPLDPRADRNEETFVIVKDYIAGMTDRFALDLYDNF